MRSVTRSDALRMIGKTRAATRVESLTAATLAIFPALQPWLVKKALVLLEHESDWDQILAVLSWFAEHPRSGLCLRQLDIPGVDTKFIEARKPLLSELLDLTQSQGPLDSSAKSFEARYGLRSKPQLVRFRILDAGRRIGGLSDITTPISEFTELQLGVSRIFITENETNGLAFPDVRDSALPDETLHPSPRQRLMRDRERGDQDRRHLPPALAEERGGGVRWQGRAVRVVFHDGLVALANDVAVPDKTNDEPRGDEDGPHAEPRLLLGGP